MDEVVAPPSAADRDYAAYADALRLLRMILAQVECGDGSPVVLDPRGPLVSIARRLVDPSEGERQATRTAVMALRDLVWRVDMFRELIGQGARIEDILDMLDTQDIHVFLNEEPSGGRDNA